MATTAKIRQDPIPGIQAAGKVIATGGHNADMAIRQDMYGFEGRGNMGTPPHIRKFRKTHDMEPGKIVVHHGLREGRPEIDPTRSFGKKGLSSDPVAEVVKAQNLNGLADKFNDAKEAKYASAVREPLGQAYQRGYNWPQQVADPQKHSFGVPTGYSLDAKEVLYPADGSLEEKSETQKMYQRTHGNFAPGEQRTREYDWASNSRVGNGTGNPITHAFGYGEQRLLAGASKAIHPERTEESFPKTVIVKKIVEDQKAVVTDMLGTVRNLGQGVPDRDPSKPFGAAKKMQEWNAAKCINGDPTERELQPDSDLGRATKKNCTNEVRYEQDRDRAFGCPTIRTDIPFKEVRTLADFQNYGDEPEAVDLLFPATFVELGVTEADFQQMRDRQTIKNLFESIGYSYKIGKFNAIYNKAKENCNSQDDRVSCRSFMSAIQQFHNFE